MKTGELWKQKLPNQFQNEINRPISINQKSLIETEICSTNLCTLFTNICWTSQRLGLWVNIWNLTQLTVIWQIWRNPRIDNKSIGFNADNAASSVRCDFHSQSSMSTQVYLIFLWKPKEALKRKRNSRWKKAHHFTCLLLPLKSLQFLLTGLLLLANRIHRVTLFSYYTNWGPKNFYLVSWSLLWSVVILIIFTDWCKSTFEHTSH